ncbi:thiolase [Myriangium duriaei CBS 260.36]|uniref:Thiolase n=1 Tax=Myriangium duriaei CBS 260.36 TaxID=1168546 RepID=A0A9P4IZW8_9PEZI|nr:thiolase [Myriangium duriaei CBS 260.36]
MYVPPEEREPVIIGVGDIVNREPLNPLDPRRLIHDAVEAAIFDTDLESSLELRQAVKEVIIVKPWTWSYSDLPRHVAKDCSLGDGDSEWPINTRESEHGGHNPLKALDRACREVIKGQQGVCVIAGGEALATLAEYFKKDRPHPPRNWQQVDKSEVKVFSPTTAELPAHTLGSKHGIGAPIQVYPLYENAWRAHKGQSRAENHAESAKLYAAYAERAAANPNSWSYGRKPETEESIAKVDKRNRMICYPYPLLMNAFNNVNLSAAAIVTSVRTAKRLGVHKDKWIYCLSGGGTNEDKDFWKRKSFIHSAAIAQTIDKVIDASGYKAEDIHLTDFYSCFPIVPKLAAEHLGRKLDVNTSLLGGLTSFGGAGNNYSMHAVTEMTRQLRDARRKSSDTTNGLILANGGVLTSQFAAFMSTHSRPDRRMYPMLQLLPDVMGFEHRGPIVVAQADGEAIVETYTVDFNRDGTPRRGHIVGRLKDGKRFLANHADRETLAELIGEEKPEPIGRRGWVRNNPTTGVNEFSFGEAPKGKL